jgi:hypothetical protein
MAWDGFLVVGYEGPSVRAGIWNALSRPPVVAGVRPDAWGYDQAGERVALGEAKTGDDIDTEHTRVQLQAYRRLRVRGSRRPCRLYIAIPRSAARELDRVLADVGLVGDREIVRLHVPDIFLTEGEAA